jgi:acyl carrier protein
MPGADATVARPRPMAEPKSAVEAVIARIWAAVLKRPVIDAEANFFDLGGNSLSSVQIMSRIREVFRVELELHRLFDAPTVAELAAMVEKDPRLHLAEPDDADDERIEPALTRTFAMLGIEGVSMSHEDILDLVYTLDDWEVDELLLQLQPHAGQG